MKADENGFAFIDRSSCRYVSKADAAAAAALAAESGQRRLRRRLRPCCAPHKCWGHSSIEWLADSAGISEEMLKESIGIAATNEIQDLEGQIRALNNGIARRDLEIAELKKGVR